MTPGADHSLSIDTVGCPSKLGVGSPPKTAHPLPACTIRCMPGDRVDCLGSWGERLGGRVRGEAPVHCAWGYHPSANCRSGDPPCGGWTLSVRRRTFTIWLQAGKKTRSTRRGCSRKSRNNSVWSPPPFIRRTSSRSSLCCRRFENEPVCLCTNPAPYAPSSPVTFILD